MILGPLYKIDSKGKVRVISVEVDGDKFRVISGLEDGAKTTNKWTTCKAKNVGRANATTAEEQAFKEAAAKYDKKLREDYFASKEQAQETYLFKPMLAKEATDDDIIALLKEHDYLLVDPKLDGMRLITTQKTYRSRRGKDVPTAQWVHKDLEDFFEVFPNVTLDGELYNHTYRDNFGDLMSLARKGTSKPLTPEQRSNSRKLLQYYVYDAYYKDCPGYDAHRRKDLLRKTLITGDRVKLLRYEKVTTLEEFEAAHKRNLQEGYEGSIIRVPTEPYKQGRSKFMLKYKDFKTAEFTIIDILPGKGNRSDIAGRVIVDVNGVEVGCGIRGDWEYAHGLLKNRNEYINKDATIRFFEWTEDGSLRFPVCIDVARWEHE